MNTFTRSARIVALCGILSLSAFNSQAEGISSVPASANTKLSLSDQKIYDESLNLINQYSGKGDALEKAYKMLTDLVSRNPNSGYPYAAFADLKFRLAGMQNGSYSDAYTLAQRALKLDQNIPDAYVVIAKVLIEQGRIKYAREAALKAITLAPNKPEAMFVMARSTEEWAKAMLKESSQSGVNFGDPVELWAESERWYHQAIDTYDDNIRKANMYSWLGKMLSEKTPANIIGAAEAYTKSAELAFNDSPWLLNNAGWFLTSNTDQFDQAIVYFEQALKLMEFGAAHTGLGLAEYYKWGDAQQNPSKYLQAQKKPLTPKAITDQTGVTAEYAFVMNASVKGQPNASMALLKNRIIKNVDVVPRGLDSTALFMAASANHLDLAKQLITKGANLNYADGDGDTPIYYPIIRNYFEMVKLLISKGARLNLNRPLSSLALSMNQESGKSAPILLNYLLQHGADPTIPDKYGHTILSSAVSWNDVEAVRLLVNEYHVNVNIYIPSKQSSLLEGAKSEVATILLKAGANPWVRGMDDVDIIAKMMSSLNKGNPNWGETKKAAALILEARKRVPKPKDFGSEYQGEVVSLK
ncbi:MAG: ankyrin repeat domain-containing protein [Gallionella sp.]|nr:ankyrin repeat domain-containing protein [Gallionella sp.]